MDNFEFEFWEELDGCLLWNGLPAALNLGFKLSSDADQVDALCLSALDRIDFDFVLSDVIIMDSLEWNILMFLELLWPYCMIYTRFRLRVDVCWVGKNIKFKVINFSNDDACSCDQWRVKLKGGGGRKGALGQALVTVVERSTPLVILDSMVFFMVPILNWDWCIPVFEIFWEERERESRGGKTRKKKV